MDNLQKILELREIKVQSELDSLKLEQDIIKEIDLIRKELIKRGIV